MKAKDTIMTDEQIAEVLDVYSEFDITWVEPEETKANRICKAQAEISFKAGIREVVDWLEEHKYWFALNEYTVFQAKKKEWES